MATRQFFHQVVQSRHSEARWSIASALPLCDMVTLERLIRNSQSRPGEVHKRASFFPFHAPSASPITGLPI
jgi:hypothetical protein